MRFHHCCIAAAIAAATTLANAEPVPSSFTYQGVLEVDGQPVQTDADFVVRLYDDNTLVTSITELSVPVQDGRFALDLDFGASFFDGTNYDIEFLVRSPAGIGAYEALGDRQPLTTNPYAFHANTADELIVPAVIDNDAPGVLLTLNQTNTANDIATLRATWGAVGSTFINFLNRVIEVDTVDAPIGVLSVASRFPIAGILNDAVDSTNNAAILGQVQPDAPESARAIWALNQRSDNSAFLGTETHAGDFTGDVRVSGDITTSYAFGTYDLAAPIAYGFVSFSATPVNGTPNFSATWSESGMRYEIEIDNESYFFNEYVTIITPNSSGITARVSSSGGRMLVYLERVSDGTRTTGSFQFVTYKPSGPVSVAGTARRGLQPLPPSIPDDQIVNQHAPAAPRIPLIENETTQNPLMIDN